VDVEPRILEVVGSGRVSVPRSTPLAFTRSSDGLTVVPARTDSGDCSFHQASRCTLHTAGGESLLPSACRHFPRVYLRDARGDLLTLSHFCPTAASLLLADGPVRVVEAPRPLSLDEPIEGLDARDALPPLLRPGMLADIDGYAAWEQAVIATFVETSDVASALAAIGQATETVRQWTPTRGPLRDRVQAAFAAARGFTPHPPPPAPQKRPEPLSAAFALVRELTGPHPLMDVPGDFEGQWARVNAGAGASIRRITARYLAATAFANWIAYRGQGLRSIVAWLRACHDVLRVQIARAVPAGAIDEAATIGAIRMTDYLMVHTVDSLAFGRKAVDFER
jgi:hypothetical protein